jgi:hypothetical protein
MAIEKHQEVSVLWIKKFITLAVKQSVDRPFDRRFSPEDHYRDLGKAARLWQAVLNFKDWETPSDQSFKENFASIFLENILSELDFSYSLRTS